MPEGRGVPVMNILDGGEEISDPGLRPREEAATLGSRCIEVEVAEVLHVLPRSIRGSELDEPRSFPKSMPPGNGLRRIRVGEGVPDAGQFGSGPVVVRTRNDDAEVAIERRFEGYSHCTGIGYSGRHFTAYCGDRCQSAKGVSLGSR